MRSFILFSLSFLFLLNSNSQSDTLFFKNKTKVPVKLFEVTETTIKYKRSDLTDGPLYQADTDGLLKIKYSNGTETLFLTDELMSLQNISEVVQQRQAFKFHVFDLPTGKLSFGYERVLRTGINLETKLGVFSSNIYSAFNNSYDRNTVFNPLNAGFSAGTFVKGGTKFLLGESSTQKGTRYTHLLAGNYIKFEAYLSYIQMNDVVYYVQSNTASSNINGYPYYAMIEKTTDLKNYNFGFLISLGKQHVLANILTLDYHAGVGFNASSTTSTNKDFTQNYNSSTGNVLAAQRLGSFLAGSVGFSLGYIHTNKAAKRQQTVVK